MKKVLGSAAGGVGAAFGSMLCCTGPLIMAAAGMSAGMLSSLRPYRFLFIAAAVGLLWFSFRLVDLEEARECESGTVCASPRARRTVRGLLWVAVVVSAVFMTSPRWAEYVFRP